MGKTLDARRYAHWDKAHDLLTYWGPRSRGSFRLLQRLFPQIQRVPRSNDLDTITDDVIEAAQSTLVVGAT